MIAVKQFVSLYEAKRGNETVNRRANCYPALSQISVVLRGRRSEMSPTAVEDGEFLQIPLEVRKMRVASNPLQDLAKDQVRQAKPTAADLIVQPERLRVGKAR